MKIFRRLLLSFVTSGLILSINTILFLISLLFVSGSEALGIFIFYLWPVIFPIPALLFFILVWMATYTLLIK